LVGMPSNPRSSNGTDANPNEIKRLAAKGEREAIENGSLSGGPLCEYFFAENLGG
jgi:hypothetical protein